MQIAFLQFGCVGGISAVLMFIYLTASLPMLVDVWGNGLVWCIYLFMHVTWLIE